MNKTDLIKAVASKTALTQETVSKTLDGILSEVTGSLKNGDAVTLPGFGTFKVSSRAARQGRNPRTGETIQIKASKLPSFSAGKTLKDTLNG